MDRRFWNGRRVLITGGTGFIGSHLTDRLLDSGAALTVASRTRRSRLHPTLAHPERIEYRIGDLRERDFARRCTHGKDVVFHFASKIAGLGYNSRHPGEMMADNAILDLQVLDAAARNGVRLFFYPSGALVYDKDAAVPISADASVTGDPLDSCKGASWAKRLCERAIPLLREEYGMDTIIARFSNIYGPGDNFEPDCAHLLGNTIRLVANGEAPEIWGDGTQRRSYLYVESAIEAILLLTERGSARGPLNIGGQVEYSVKDIVNLVIAISGKPLTAIFHADCPTGLDRKLLDSTPFRELTGFRERVSLEEGLRQTYDWYLARTALSHAPPPCLAETRGPR